MYEYRAKVINVVDGDTVDVDIDLGFDIILRDERVRIVGIDAPESRSLDRVEKLFGNLSTKRVKELLEGDVILQTRLNKSGEDMRGKFGRVLGDFKIGNRLLTDILIKEGHAVPFYNGSEEDINAHHLANRKKLLAEGIVTREELDAAEEETRRLKEQKG